MGKRGSSVRSRFRGGKRKKKPQDGFKSELKLEPEFEEELGEAQGYTASHCLTLTNNSRKILLGKRSSPNSPAYCLWTRECNKCLLNEQINE